MSSIPQATFLYPQHASTSPHSNGSYSPVFAVLAVITILSISACIIARLCARRICQPHPRSDNGFYKGDVENRFDSSIPAGKLAKLGQSEAAWIGGKSAESAGKRGSVFCRFLRNCASLIVGTRYPACQLHREIAHRSQQ